MSSPDRELTGFWWRISLHERTRRPSWKKAGQTFLFDYGELVIKVRYASAIRLEWEQVKRPSVGLKGQETYRFAAVRPNVDFIWWKEKDTSVVTQVVDFQERKVYTTWISPKKKVEHFQGKIVPVRN